MLSLFVVDARRCWFRRLLGFVVDVVRRFVVCDSCAWCVVCCLLLCGVRCLLMCVIECWCLFIDWCLLLVVRCLVDGLLFVICMLLCVLYVVCCLLVVSVWSLLRFVGG